MTNETQEQELKANSENPKCCSIVCNAGKFFKVIMSLMAAENVPLYLLAGNDRLTNASPLEILTGDTLRARSFKW